MDPNSIVGKPTEREVWLAPDWSAYEPITKKQPSGYTRVSVRETTYADGRVVTHVLDANRQPITTQILDQTTDDDQAKRWKEQQAAANKPPEERNNNGRRERWNPSAGKWEDIGAAVDTSATAGSAATSTTAPRVPAGSVPRVEGTPIPGTNPVQYDNSRPIKAWHTPDGKVIYEDLSKDEREQWEREQGGGLSVAEQRAQQQKDDQTPVDVSYTGTGKNRQKVTTYKSGRKATEAAPQNATPTSTTYETRGGKPVKVIKNDDGTETIEEQKPAAGQVIKGGGANGEDVQAVAGPDGRITYQPIQGATPSADTLPVPADAPKFTPNYNQDDLGLTAYNDALMAWARQGGPERRRVGKQLLEQAGALATQTASHGTTLRSQAQTGRGQDITQRGQDINEVASRRGDANSQFQSLFGAYDKGAANLMGGEGGLASQAFLAALDLGRNNAQQWGGLTDVPRVPPAYQQAIGGGMPGMGSTQIVLHPGGNVEVSPIGAPAPVVPGAPPAAQNAGAGTGEPPARGNIPAQPVSMGPSFVNPSTGGFGIPGFVYPGDQPSPAPADYVGAIRPQFTPDRAALRAQFPDLSDEDIDMAIQEHMMGSTA